MRVLLIEDDPMIGKSLRQALQNESMVVDWTRSGVEGEEALVSNDYGVVLLDLNLPDKNGIDVLRSTRQSGNKAPLLVITARDEVDDRIAGLDLGADDYMVKPFDTRELVARIRAVQRRRSGTARSMLQTGTITLDLATHEMTYGGQSPHPVGAGVRADAGADGAAGHHPVARPARGAPLRLGRGGREQRPRRADPFAAEALRQGYHPQSARRRLDGPEGLIASGPARA